MLKGSGLNYNTEKGESSIGLGFTMGLNYSYPLKDNRWSVVGGIQLAKYNSRISLDNDFQYVSNEVDDKGSAFQFQVIANEYKESQSLYSLNIPLLIEYATYVSRYSKFYILGGFKIIVPISQSASSKANQLMTTGYYPNVNLTVIDLPQHGFGTITNWKDSKTPLNLSTSIALSLQSGFDFYLGNNLCYTGMYLDYGLNDISNSKKEGNMIAYNPKGLDKNIAKGIANSTLVKSVKTMSFGLNFKVFF